MMRQTGMRRKEDAMFVFLPAALAGACAGYLLYRTLLRHLPSPRLPFMRKPASPGRVDPKECPPNFEVLDKDGKPVSLAWDEKNARRVWEEQLNQEGKIVHLETGEDHTPKKDPKVVRIAKKVWRWLKSFFRGPQARPLALAVNEKEDEEAAKVPFTNDDVNLLARLTGRMTGNPQSLDENLICRILKQIIAMDLPIFKIAKKRMDDTVEIVPIKRTRRMVRQKEVPDAIAIKEPASTVRKRSIVPEDDLEIDQIGDLSELRRVAPRHHLLLPKAILAKKLAERDLHVPRFVREEPEGPEKTRRVRITRTVDEPYLEDYIDQMTVRREPTAQLLYILWDGSGSMNGVKAILAAAVAIAVVRRGMDNQSRFFFRNFDAEPGARSTAENRWEKEGLIRRIINESYTGGDTDIEKAVREAMADIHSVQDPDEQAEILVVTDGGSTVNSGLGADLTDAKITLHSVLIDGWNQELEQASNTCTKLTTSEFSLSD
jgi:hypothetical protein